MKKCTGVNCPMQFDSVDPANCKAVDSCQYATPPITNGDRIRAMSDNELARFLAELADCRDCPAEEPCREYSMDGCRGGILLYLKSEVNS